MVVVVDRLEPNHLLDSRSNQLTLKMDTKVLDLLDFQGSPPAPRMDIVRLVLLMEKHLTVEDHLDHSSHLVKVKYKQGHNKELMAIQHQDPTSHNSLLAQEHQNGPNLVMVKHSLDLNQALAIFYLINKNHQMEKLVLNRKKKEIIPLFPVNLEETILFYPMCQKPHLVAMPRNTVVTMPMSRLDVKYSTSAPIITHMILFVQMVLYSTRNILSVFGGTSLIATLQLRFIELMKISTTSLYLEHNRLVVFQLRDKIIQI